MQSKPATFSGSPPRLINSVVVGFNTVAGNIHLILIPIVLDIFLWLGPHLRINVLMQPLFEEWVNTVNQVGSADMVEVAQASRKVFPVVMEHFNLFSVLRTWPIGVPSLVAPLAPLDTPFGAAPVSEMASLDGAFWAWAGLLLVGLVLGALYFGSVAQSTAEQPGQFSARRVLWSAGQTIILTVILVVAGLLAAVPIFLLLTVVSLINVAVAQVVVLVLTFFLLWALLPLVFSPHGIFSYGLSAVHSLGTSLRLVRRYLPGTGMFLAMLIVLSEGLKFIWQAAPENSWMFLVGICGHAFISTALLAASFIYYQGGMRWMQEKQQEAQAALSQA